MTRQPQHHSVAPMQHAPRNRVLGAMLLCLPLLACSQADQHGRQTGTDIQSRIQDATRDIGDKVQTAMATEDISLSTRDTAAPEAKISPQGDLLIDGKPVPLTAAQRKLALAYREQITAMAAAGASIGGDAAGIAGTAVSGALASVFGGDSSGFKAEMEAAGEKIRHSTLALCDRLPALRQAQDALAASVPEFRPYAQMGDDDVADCRKDAEQAGKDVRDAGHDAGAALDEAHASMREATANAHAAADNARDAARTTADH